MTLKEVLKELKRLQKETGKHPTLFTKALVISKTKIKDWDLRKLGGLGGIVRANFPMGDKELADMRELKDTASYINKLERELGQKKLFEQKALELISGIKPIKRIAPYKPKTKGKIKRELNLVLSDTHYGIEVHPEAVNEVNTYNWTVAARRTAMVVDETIKYKRDKRDEVTQLNVFIIGDIIGGLIHGTNYRELDLLIHQQNGALHTLAHALSLLVPNFPKIKVICLSGNHDDNVTKRSGGRVVTEKFDSFINHTYYALSAMFRENKSVEFDVSAGLYAMHDGIGGRIMATHGDVMFSKSLGNPGTSISVKPLANAISAFNSGEVAKGNKPVSAVLFGHVHTYSQFVTYEGVHVLTNPSLSGVDGYAHSLGINNNQIGQILFESVKDYVVGDSRLIRIHGADKDASYDKLIPPYNKGLQWKA